MIRIRLAFTLSLFALVLTLPVEALPVCADRDAKASSDEKALSYFRKQGEIFHPARVLKRHNTSRHKEVASYVQFGDKKYSIFTVVDIDCRARFIKRTRQGD